MPSTTVASSRRLGHGVQRSQRAIHYRKIQVHAGLHALSADEDALPPRVLDVASREDVPPVRSAEVGGHMFDWAADSQIEKPVRHELRELPRVLSGVDHAERPL